MKDNPDLKKLWQDASRSAEERNTLSKELIMQAIEAKSKDILSQFRREKLTGIISGLVIIPVLIIGFMITYSVNIWTILFTIIVLASTLISAWDGFRQLAEIKKHDPSASLYDHLKEKFDYLTAQLNKARIISPLTGVTIYIPLMLIYLFLESGDLMLGRTEWLVMLISVVFIIFASGFIVRVQRTKYLKSLEECLKDLTEMEAPQNHSGIRINLAIILTLILLISVIVFLLVR